MKTTVPIAGEILAHLSRTQSYQRVQDGTFPVPDQVRTFLTATDRTTSSSATTTATPLPRPRLQPLQKAHGAGLPRIKLHAARHTAATLALEAGIDIKIVSDQLGHSTTRITQDLYQHTLRMAS